MRRVVAVVLIGLTAAIATAETIVFQDGVSPTAAYSGTRDVHLESVHEPVWDPDANYRLLDLEAEGEPLDKSVVFRWDVSAIPSSATIIGASLTVEARGTSAGFEVYEALRPWNENEATGFVASAGVPWSVPCAAGVGTDRGGTILGELDAPGPAGLTTPLNDAGLAVIGAWVNGSRPNNGLVVQDFFADDGLDVAGMYDSAIDERPMLQVQWAVNNVLGDAQFRNGILPTASYAGGTGTTLACGRGPGRESYGTSRVMSAQGGTDPKSILVKFDLTQLPRNAVVSAAELKFVVRNGTQQQYAIYEQQRPWTEEASFDFADGVRPWGAPGAVGSGDHDGVELGRIGPTTSSGPHQAQLNDAGIQLVQKWITLALPNSGFFIHDHGVGTTTDDLDVHSSETEIVTNRPSLVIGYAIPPGTIGLIPSQAFVAPGGVIVFRTAGGTAPFSWEVGVNSSGASVDDGGRYVAGPYGGGVDKVIVTDGTGLKASTAVSVAAGGLPRPKADAGGELDVDAGVVARNLPPLEVANFGCSATGGIALVFAIWIVALARARSRWSRRTDSE